VNWRIVILSGTTLGTACVSPSNGIAVSRLDAMDAMEPRQIVQSAVAASSAEIQAPSNHTPFEADVQRDLEIRARITADAELARRITEARQQRDALSEAYQRAGSPRIAVLLNRELSDSVLEWSVERGMVISPLGRIREFGLVQRIPLQGAREQRSEGWMWAFEDALFAPCLEAGVRLVDRATILRLAANASGADRDLADTSSQRAVEMDALRGHADYLVEALVQADGGMDPTLLARVIEVSSGQIMAHSRVSCAPVIYPALPLMRKNATRVEADGYSFVEVVFDPNGFLPEPVTNSPSEGGERLALDVIRQLALRL